MLRTSRTSRPRHLLAAASLVALAACRPAPESAPVTDSTSVASGPTACDELRAVLDDVPVAATGSVDVATLREGLATLSSEARVEVLVEIAQAGPAAAPLADDVAAMLTQLDPAEGLSEAWTALRAMDPVRARELALATLSNEASAPRRVAAARTLAASGTQGVSALFDAAAADRAEIAAAADMALAEATTHHPRAVLAVAFGPDGACADLARARCSDIVRELAPFAPELIGQLPDTPRGRLLAAELDPGGAEALAGAIRAEGVAPEDALDALRSRALRTPGLDAVPVTAALPLLADPTLPVLARRELAWMLIERADRLPASADAVPAPSAQTPADELTGLLSVVSIAARRPLTDADVEAALSWLQTTRSETGVVTAGALLASGVDAERVREALLVATMPPARYLAAMSVVAPDDAGFVAAVTADGVSALLANDLALLRLRAAELGRTDVQTDVGSLVTGLRGVLDDAAWAALAARLDAGQAHALAYPASSELPGSGLAAAWLFDEGDAAAVAAMVRRGLATREVGPRLAAARLVAARPDVEIPIEALSEALVAVSDEFAFDPVSYRTTLARAVVVRGGLPPEQAAGLLREARETPGEAGATLVAMHALSACDSEAAP